MAFIPYLESLEINDPADDGVYRYLFDVYERPLLYVLRFMNLIDLGMTTASLPHVLDSLDDAFLGERAPSADLVRFTFPLLISQSGFFPDSSYYRTSIGKLSIAYIEDEAKRLPTMAEYKRLLHDLVEAKDFSTVRDNQLQSAIDLLHDRSPISAVLTLFREIETGQASTGREEQLAEQLAIHSLDDETLGRKPRRASHKKRRLSRKQK